MRPLLDELGNEVEFDQHSVLLNETLAKILDVKPGETFTVQPLTGERKSVKLTMTGTTNELIALWVHMGADPLATAVAVQSFQAGRPLHAFIVRKEPKGHGTGQWLETARRLDPARPVVIVEDVVTTGASTIKAIERATASGLTVAAVVALVDRLEGGRAAVEAHAPLVALFDRRDFLP